MLRIKSYSPRRHEQGNVLFLILIAVALFAALSYAVTQSTRSGGGSTERERMELDIAATLNTVSAFQTEILRRSLDGRPMSLTTNPGDIGDPGEGFILQFPSLELKSSDPVAGSENEFIWYLAEGIMAIDDGSGISQIGTTEREI